MANQVTLTFAGDSKSLERTFERVGAGAKDMGRDFDKAGDDARRFGSKMDGVNDSVDKSEGKFMASADLLDGLGTAFGLPFDGATNLARGFGDLASGVTGVVIPAVQGILGKLGLMTGATVAQAGATEGAAVAQGGLNAALLANPVGLVIAAIVALVAAFVLAWQHSETFRNIVRGALDVVKGAAEGLLNFFKDLPGNIASAGGKLIDVITWPYKTAFNAIAKLWNNTVGQLSFEVPSWVPFMGGNGFSMPQLPTFHNGGVVPGNPGNAIPVLAMAGERISRAGESSSGSDRPFLVQLVVDKRVLAEAVSSGQRVNQSRGFAR